MRKYANLFEELQLDGILEELSHGTGTMVHKGFLIKCYWFFLKTWENTESVSNTFNILFSVPSSPGI